MSLIIVPGHSIWKYFEGYDSEAPGTSPSEWELASFQKEADDHLAFIEHVKIGVDQLIRTENSILIFSGGQTKESCGPISEGQSYWFLAKALGLYENQSVASRIHTEEYARDSFENVLFSILRYKEIVGDYPKSLTIVGLGFKKARFVHQHFPALSWEGEYEYISVGPTLLDSFFSDCVTEAQRKEKEEAYFSDLEFSEMKYAVSEFSKDPFGKGPVLSAKRRLRDPFKRGCPYRDEKYFDMLDAN
ncbi:hypothetical protein LJB42_003928 [Komagataella kurtzmanii]|nr:hypothetical protein LJB42_003928 [Komagataella kurtzmanii]